MPIDTSIYSNITPIDPLGQVGKIAATQQALADARRAQLGLQGDVSLGQHIQSAIDPATGQVDTNKLVAGVKSDPNAFMAAGPATTLALSQRGSQIANASAGVNLNQQNMSNLGSIWASRAARTQGPISPRDLEGDVIDGVITGRITPDFGKAVLRTIPDGASDARDFAVGGFVSALPPGMTAGAAPAAPSASGAPQQQSGAGFATQTLGGGGGPGAIPTGLSPGASAALGATGEASANMGVALTQVANQVPDRLAMLNNMEAEADQFTSGPVSEPVKKMTAGINEMFGTKYNIEGVAAQERFDKLSNQIAQQQAGALGITDQRERTAMGANPNSSMSNLGIKGNIALLKGNENAITTKAQAWQQYLNGGGTPDHFGAWSSQFNQQYDPRIFQSVYLVPEDRKKLAASMSPNERKAFAAKYNFAIKNGWIPDPRTTNGQ